MMAGTFYSRSFLFYYIHTVFISIAFWLAQGSQHMFVETPNPTEQDNQIQYFMLYEMCDCFIGFCVLFLGVWESKVHIIKVSCLRDCIRWFSSVFTLATRWALRFFDSSHPAQGVANFGYIKFWYANFGYPVQGVCVRVPSRFRQADENFHLDPLTPPVVTCK